LTPALLKRLGRWTWGSGWAFELALALGKHPVTVARWRAGLTAMSESDQRDILEACVNGAKWRYITVRAMVARAKTQARTKASRKSFARDMSPERHYKRLAQGLD
jgi:hypothetical protein